MAFLTGGDRSWTEGQSDHLERLQAALAERYRFLRELGKGGMASVWLVEDLVQGRQVALKVLHPELAASIGGDRFHREIEIAAALTHPHILPIYDSGEAGGLLYYTMPFVDGESLRDRLRREVQLPIEDTLRYVREVADALGYAHAHGVVHRDVKPENILFEGDHAVLADFGVARAVDAGAAERLTATGLAVGTPAYMSPEQAGGETRLDGRSDVYSLGCVLFEMLAGEPPFSGPTPQAIAAKHLASPPPPVRLTRGSVPEAVERVIVKALAKVPADRFRNAEELSRAIQAVPREESRSWRVTFPVAVIALIVGLSIIAVLLAYRNDWFRSGARALTTAAANTPPRVAVLYFHDPAPGSPLQSLADGVTEELIHELSGVDAFRVISRAGVMPYRGRRTPFDSMVAALRVTAVVDGDIQRVSGGVRVRAQLIDAQSDTYLDSMSFARPVADTGLFQREAAQILAAQVRRRLGREARLRDVGPGSTNPAAVALTQRARREREDAEEMVEQGHPEDLRTALAALDRADSLLRLAQSQDPGWHRPQLDRGWVTEARARLLGGKAKVDVLREGLADIDRGIRQWPADAEALEVRGVLRWLLALEMVEGGADSVRLREVERDLRAALAQDSTLAKAWATLSFALWAKGSLAEAGIAARRALREDAYLEDANDVLIQLFFSDLYLEHFPQAAEWVRRGRLAFVDDWRFVQCALTLLRSDVTAKPDPAYAWALVDTLDAMDPPAQTAAEGRPYHTIYRRVVAATVSARAGQVGRARAELARALRATASDSTLRLDLAYDEAVLRLALGERERAAALIQDLIAARPLQGPILRRDPLLRSLRLQG
jgi:eukaryotic-like serine/threonine-protein kinase